MQVWGFEFGEGYWSSVEYVWNIDPGQQRVPGAEVAQSNDQNLWMALGGVR